MNKFSYRILLAAVVTFAALFLLSPEQASFAQSWQGDSIIRWDVVVEAMPENESGIGAWEIRTDEEEAYRLIVTEETHIPTSSMFYPSVGDTIQVLGILIEDDEIEALSILLLNPDLPDFDNDYWDDSDYGDDDSDHDDSDHDDSDHDDSDHDDSDHDDCDHDDCDHDDGEHDTHFDFDADFDTRWRSVTGVVILAPEDESGVGEWKIELDSDEIVYVLADEYTYFIGEFIPTEEDEVLVEGFLTPDDEFIAEDIELLSGASNGDYFNGEIEELVGIVISLPESTLPIAEEEAEAWRIQTLDGPQTVFVSPDTTFDGSRPSLNDRISVWGYRFDSNFFALEVTPDLFETGEIIVRLNTDVISQTIASRYNLFAESAVLESGGIYKFVSYNPRDQYVQRIVKKMFADEDIIWAERNMVAEIPVQDERHRSWAWGVPSDTEYNNQSAYEQINLPPAHTQYLGDDVVIAVLDTGADLDHPELQSHLIQGWDMVDDDSLPDDEGPGIAWGHGTHVSGIVAKVAPNSKIMPIRVLDSSGRGDIFLVAYAIQWAVEQGADVINLSLGVGQYPRVLHRAVQYATDEGVVVVAAAGNSNVSAAQYPAGFPETVGVAAVDSSGQKASFSNYGGWVSMSAPGVGIRSTIVGPDGSGYATWDGTSMAAPFVAGAAALVQQKVPFASSYAVTELLRDPSSQYANLVSTSTQQNQRIGQILDVASSVGISEPEQNNLVADTVNAKVFLPVIGR